MYHPDPFFSDLEDPLFWEGVTGQPISRPPLSPDPSPAWRTPTRYIIIEEAPQSQVVEGWLLPAPPPISTALTLYEPPVTRLPVPTVNAYEPAPAKERNPLVLLCGLGALCILLGILFNTFVISTSGSPSSTSSRASGSTATYSLIGSPTVSADFINRVLTHYHSPAVGEGQKIYDEGVADNIDPVYALAFFMHESGFGTSGEARYSLSIGNLRCLDASYDYLHPTCIDNFSWFPSWDNGIEAWYRLIKVGYIQGAINKTVGYNACPCLTVDQIIPVYAPHTDGNNEAAYIAAVKQEVLAWRRGTVAVL